MPTAATTLPASSNKAVAGSGTGWPAKFEASLGAVAPKLLAQS